MRKLFVETANFRRVYSNIAEVSHRASGLPGIAVVVAPPGFGKTWSCVRTVDSIGAIYTSAKAGWAKSWMLSDVCRELGIPPTSRCQVMFNDIVEALRKINGVLVVDEADYLPRRPETMEVLRDIHDHSGAALVFVGTEQFMFGLQKYPQISGRVMRWVELEDLSLDDTRLLSEKLVELKVADDLVARVFERSCGSIRRSTLALAQIETFAMRHSLSSIGLQEWGDARQFDFSSAPMLPSRRRRPTSIVPQKQPERPARMVA